MNIYRADIAYPLIMFSVLYVAFFIIGGTLILFLFRKKRAAIRLKWFLGLALAASAVSSIIAFDNWTRSIRPRRFREHQVKISCVMQRAAQFLLEYKLKYGDFPDQLSKAMPVEDEFYKHRWKYDLHYEHRSGAFILVDYGSDGKPDGIDYWALRERNNVENVLGKFSTDLIVSDLGSHRVAGKG